MFSGTYYAQNYAGMIGWSLAGSSAGTKWKRFGKSIKEIKDKHNKTGEEWSQWKFHDKLDEILDSHPATHLPVVLETLDHQTKDSSDETDTGEELEENNISNHSGLADDSISDTSHNTDQASVSEQNLSDNHDQKRVV